MRNFKIFKYLLIISILIITGNLSGQKVNPEDHGEKVSLVTDRNLYITGEAIQFAAYIHVDGIVDSQNSSKVLYCEVITDEGVRISGNKFAIKNNACYGEIIIPADASTGVYFLKAYTRYMRNRGPSTYHYTMIKAVNARSSEIREKEELLEMTDFVILNSNSTPSDPVELIYDRKIYKTGDSVHIIVGKAKSNAPLTGISISVVPENTVSTTFIDNPANESFSGNLLFRREKQGPVISGKLLNDSTGAPVADSRVNLSVIGEHKDFIAQKTDSAGNFEFSMPDYYGCHDIFLCTDDSILSKINLLIDNDFCPAVYKLPSYRFSLTEQESNVALQMAVNLQVESYFKADSPKSEENGKPGNVSFYGNPSDILNMDDYVSLPTLEDYFNSLPSLVKVKKQSGKKYFRISGTQSGLDSYEPLVLVDMVAFGDPEKVLALQPSVISRIEVVNSLYIKGDEKYGGIINIITRKGDFGGIDLPSSGIFINYCFLAEGNGPGVKPSSPEIPDTRSTLFWMPRIEFNNKNLSEIVFSTSDTPGKYLIVLSWINLNGNLIRQTSGIEVRK